MESTCLFKMFIVHCPPLLFPYLMKECVNPTELTAELLNTLIEKIVVHEAVKGEDGSREQEVEIFYRFIGKID